MFGQRQRVEEARDGPGWKIDVFNLTKDDADNGTTAERNKNDVSREEFLVGRIG